jgi:hypothetical protein
MAEEAMRTALELQTTTSRKSRLSRPPEPIDPI